MRRARERGEFAEPETLLALLSLIRMRERVLLSLVATLGWMSCAAAQASPNHLAGEHSAYLRRATGQPVDWYPWNEEAFKRAKALNRPLLLDVGAVWCPWCGLMERDTYTNPETADYINQHFVAVKVDFDASARLVAQLQRAQAFLNLPAGPTKSALSHRIRCECGWEW